MNHVFDNLVQIDTNLPVCYTQNVMQKIISVTAVRGYEWLVCRGFNLFCQTVDLSASISCEIFTRKATRILPSVLTEIHQYGFKNEDVVLEKDTSKWMVRYEDGVHCFHRLDTTIEFSVNPDWFIEDIPQYTIGDSTSLPSAIDLLVRLFEHTYVEGTQANEYHFHKLPDELKVDEHESNEEQIPV